MKRPGPEEYTTAQRNCAIIRSQASAANSSISFVQQWLLDEGPDLSVCSAVSVETTTLRYIAQTLLNPESLMEILTAIAILPFLAALVVGAREAEQDRQ